MAYRGRGPSRLEMALEWVVVLILFGGGCAAVTTLVDFLTNLSKEIK